MYCAAEELCRQTPVSGSAVRTSPMSSTSVFCALQAKGAPVICSVVTGGLTISEPLEHAPSPARIIIVIDAPKRLIDSAFIMISGHLRKARTLPPALADQVDLVSVVSKDTHPSLDDGRRLQCRCRAFGRRRVRLPALLPLPAVASCTPPCQARE